MYHSSFFSFMVVFLNSYLRNYFTFQDHEAIRDFFFTFISVFHMDSQFYQHYLWKSLSFALLYYAATCNTYYSSYRELFQGFFFISTEIFMSSQISNILIVISFSKSYHLVGWIFSYIHKHSGLVYFCPFSFSCNFQDLCDKFKQTKNNW